MIIDRLVYGCARLTGGVSEAASRRLVHACLDAGIRHFDTAPSYGMGTAEDVIGACIADRPDVRVTAKVGSSRGRHRVAKTYLRAAKSVFRKRVSPSAGSFVPPAPRRRADGGDFTDAAMAASLEQSRQALRRDVFDVLLLHEIHLDDVRPAIVDFLGAVQAAGGARQIGYSNGGLFEPALRAAFPPGWAAQQMVTAKALAGGLPGPSADYLHTIVKMSGHVASIDPEFSRWRRTAADLIPKEVADPETAALAIVYGLLHARFPHSGLIFASIDPSRLSSFLLAIAHIDTEIGVDRLGQPQERPE